MMRFIGEPVSQEEIDVSMPGLLRKISKPFTFIRTYLMKLTRIRMG